MFQQSMRGASGPQGMTGLPGAAVSTNPAYVIMMLCVTMCHYNVITTLFICYVTVTLKVGIHYDISKLLSAIKLNSIIFII